MNRNFVFLIGILANFSILHCASQTYCYINAGDWCSNISKKSQRHRYCTCAADLICIDNKCQERSSRAWASLEAELTYDPASLSSDGLPVNVGDGGSGAAPFECLLPLGAVCDKGLGKEISIYCKCLKGLKCKNYVCVVDDNAKSIGAKKHSNVTSNGLNLYNPDIRRKDCRLSPGSPCVIPRRSLKEICLCQQGHRCVNNICTPYQLSG